MENDSTVPAIHQTPAFPSLIHQAAAFKQGCMCRAGGGTLWALSVKQMAVEVINNK